jgi:NAD-dependent dihydropyrimidine dehydrogenase PreA subunit
MQKPAVKQKFRAAVEVNREMCKRCGICIAFCPHQVLGTTSSGYPVADRLDKCTGCKLCYYRCPDFAVEVRKEAVE